MSGKKETKKQATKSAIFSHIANETRLTKKDISAVFDSLSNLIKKTVVTLRFNSSKYAHNL